MPLSQTEPGFQGAPRRCETVLEHRESTLEPKRTPLVRRFASKPYSVRRIWRAPWGVLWGFPSVSRKGAASGTPQTARCRFTLSQAILPPAFIKAIRFFASIASNATRGIDLPSPRAWDGGCFAAGFRRIASLCS